MKKLAVCIPALALLVACGPKGKTEPGTDKDTNKTQTGQIFGDTITENGAITGNDLVTMMRTKDSANVKVTTKITEVCQKKGCWMDVELADGKTMTVRFKDYGFFVPKDAAGKTTVIDGMVRREVESVEWLKHKAEDAGKTKEEIDAITQADTTLSFEAYGVIIK